MKKYLIVAWWNHESGPGLENIRDQSNDIHLARDKAIEMAEDRFLAYDHVVIYGRDDDGVLETIKNNK